MARDYCFTDFDTTELEFEENNIKYICYGVEKCGTTGREHKQGFVIFNRTCRVPKAKVWIGGRSSAHFEVRRGTRDEARDYCRKDGGRFFEWGQFEPMTKEKLFEKSKRWLLNNGYQEFYCRYHKAINEMAFKGEKWREVKVEWLWGTAGCGKTRRVMEMESVYKLDYPYKWFDGYDSEEILLIDDYQSGAIERGQLLNLLDGYRQRLETKGGHTWALWNRVYITSNKNPMELKEWDAALIRRCDIVTGCG